MLQRGTFSCTKANKQTRIPTSLGAFVCLSVCLGVYNYKKEKKNYCLNTDMKVEEK